MSVSRPNLNQNSRFLSRFQFFLWILGAAFGIISTLTVAQADQKLYNVKGKRDPFVQLVGTGSKASTGGLLGVESLEEILVEGIVQDANPKNSILVANGSVMKEGEEVGSVKLLKIEANGGLFSVNGIEGYRALYEETKKVSGEKNS